MSQTVTSMRQQKYHVSLTSVDMKLEVDIIYVSDVERSKHFYGRLGWRLDQDVAPASDVRIVQLTPPGSACSGAYIEIIGGKMDMPPALAFAHSRLKEMYGATP
jgi:hypothetical protein